MKFRCSYESPLGILHIHSSQNGITKIERNIKILPYVSDAFLGQAQKELDEYFVGKRQQFTVPLDLSIGTPFQQEVWNTLCNISYGEVKSYSDLALLCGDIKKVRAVGRANGANPVPIIVPCHRVIGKNAKLVGYSQGLDMKAFLLKLEKAPIMHTLF